MELRELAILQDCVLSRSNNSLKLGSYSGLGKLLTTIVFAKLLLSGGSIQPLDTTQTLSPEPMQLLDINAPSPGIGAHAALDRLRL